MSDILIPIFVLNWAKYSTAIYMTRRLQLDYIKSNITNSTNKTKSYVWNSWNNSSQDKLANISLKRHFFLPLYWFFRGYKFSGCMKARYDGKVLDMVWYIQTLNQWCAHEQAISTCREQSLDQAVYFLARDLTFMRDVS